MTRKYHGTVSAKGSGTVYEEWYRTREEAVSDLKQKARETVFNSFDENPAAVFTLSRGNRVIVTRQIPGRGFHGYDANPVHFGSGPLPIGGTRIC
jgi:hypothetical protein